MPQNLTEEKPIFQQIAEQIEDAVLSGAFPEEEQIPSTTEISAAYKINPATALKGINILVEENVAYKKRGVGMFVCSGAKDRIQQKRQKAFCEAYVAPLIAEAEKLGIGRQEILSMIEKELTSEK